LSDDPEVQKRLNEINAYLTQGYTDREIYDMMKIPYSTYYNYKRQLQKESAERFKDQRLEDVARYRDELNDRWLRYLRIGEEKLEQAKETMNPTKDFASTLREVKILSKDIFDLNVEGILALHNQSNKPIKGDTTKQLSGPNETSSDEPDTSTDDNPIV
jgi:transposase